ncbi:hypothetical protein Ocin01_19614 [Orchesella cincta]|uniref:Uncharacterized protein n=1 Tax=Orchesella cincta TaxID=48709 RepID=A0A1D2M275_ORCCI|nr:hypothetical protein Ocin01_19614 [Orchesella cincta]
MIGATATEYPFINTFRLPQLLSSTFFVNRGYNVTIALPGSVGRMNPTTTAPPAGIPIRQPGMTLGSHNQPNFGGAPSMTRPNYHHEGQIRQTTMPGTPVQGNGLAIPVGVRTPQMPRMLTPPPHYDARQMDEGFPPTPPASVVTSPVGAQPSQFQ